MQVDCECKVYGMSLCRLCDARFGKYMSVGMCVHVLAHCECGAVR